MLVDLGRNDLGRVCEYGTVRVDELMEIEHYSHVMHIVSSVSGTLREGVGATDALRSVLPAGTLSGAPKVRAMQIIDELEPVKRGGYGGAVGYLTYAGDLDTAIHIRTVVVKDGVAHLQAGGGTVADAQPAYEYEESVAKMRAAMRAIALPANSRIGHESHRPRQLRLLHLQPRPVPRRTRRRGRCGPQRPHGVEELIEGGYDRCVVSPGPCTPNEAGITLEVVRRLPEAGVPTLGVCLGHQAIAQAFGGRWQVHPPVHGKATRIEHDGRTIFSGLRSPLTVGRYHSLIVDPELPDCLEQTASGDGVLMGVRHRELPAEGVQFHPESVLTEQGHELLANFLARTRPEARCPTRSHLGDRRRSPRGSDLSEDRPPRCSRRSCTGRSPRPRSPAS